MVAVGRCGAEAARGDAVPALTKNTGQNPAFAAALASAWVPCGWVGLLRCLYTVYT